MRSAASALRDKFEQLFNWDDASERGRKFEPLLRERLRLEGFQVHLNPKVATPRQTDLFARLGATDFVIEAKWRNDKIDISDIDDMRVRLQRTAADVIGCIFSMSDYSEPAIDQVTLDRTREILLFNAVEINDIFSQRAQVTDLIKIKRDQLLIRAEVYFNESSQSSAGDEWPPCKNCLLVGGRPVHWFHCRAGRGDVGFMLSNMEVNQFGPCARLHLRLNIATPQELASLFSLVAQEIGMSKEGTFSIHQQSHTWYGCGFANFLAAIDAWKTRYSEADIKSPHHSLGTCLF